MVIDLLHFARAIPTVPVQRRMQLAPLIAARAASADKPRWTAIFAKAYALVAAENPVLRRAYVKLPWPQLYEYPTSTATIMFEREHEGEPSLFSYRLRDPTRFRSRRSAIGSERSQTNPWTTWRTFAATSQSHRCRGRCAG